MTNYPAKIDGDVELPRVDNSITENSADIINSIREAILALETTLGVNPQGSEANVVDRLSAAFNDDGTFKSSALIASGLVSLPITNAQVGASAAIAESKLDLDFSTTTLQDQISSNDIDIANLQLALAQDILRLANHVIGTYDRHPSSAIDHTLADGYESGSGLTVRTVLNYIWGALLAHISHRGLREHFAAAIAYVPGANPVITANNVQDAISQINDAFFEDRRIHDDSHHSDGISGDGYVFLGGQALVNDVAARLARRPQSPHIMKLGLINGATLKSKDFYRGGLSATSSSITITAGVGSGATRSLTVTGLENAKYPTATNRVSLKGVVDYFNNAFDLAANHFPVTAFEATDGELVLQHNINRPDCTISISAPANSAATALGFAEIIDFTVAPLSKYFLQADGYNYSELSTIFEGTGLTQGSASTTVNLGVSASGLGLYANSLIHVFNHSVAAANGTYRIVSVGGGNTVNINTALAVGTYSAIIYQDTVNTDFSGNAKTIDLYIDGERQTSASTRQETLLSLVSGLKIVEVSQDFPAVSGATLNVTKSSSTYSVSITANTKTGIASTFSEGTLGYLKVYGPDNVSYVTILVHDVSPPAPRTDSINFFATEFQDNKVLLGTTHSDAASTLEIPLDRRNVGLVGLSSIGTEFIEGVLERDIGNLHLSGVVRGLNVLQIDSGSLSITVNGGSAYIDGRFIPKRRQSLQVINTAASSGIWNLLLSKDGLFEIYLEGTAGYSVSDVLAGSSHIIIAQITVLGGIVTATTDARLFINDVDSRLPITVDDREFGAGAFRSLEAAILYSKYAPNDTKPDITILSDYTITSALVVDSGSRIVSFGDLTASADITLSANSSLEVWGTFTSTGQVTLSSYATFILRGADNSFTSSATSIEVGPHSELQLANTTSLKTIEVSGYNTVVKGTEAKPVISFDGSGDGLVVDSGVSSVLIADLNFSMGSAAVPILTFTSVTGLDILRCSFSQAATLNFAQLASTLRAGISQLSGTSENLNIKECLFSNLGAGVKLAGTVTTAQIRENIFEFAGQGIICGTLTKGKVINNVFTFVRDYYIRISGTGGTENIFRGNQFSDRFNSSSNPAVFSSGVLTSSSFSANVMSGITTTSDLITCSGTALEFSDNIVKSCNTSTALVFNLAGLTGPSVISNNVVVGHTGRFISCSYATVTGNAFEGTSIGGLAALTFSTSNPPVLVSGNKFKAAATDILALESGVFSDNEVSLGKVTITDSSGFYVKGNKFILQDATAANSIAMTLSSSSSVYSLFEGNYVSAGPTAATISISNGRLAFTDNIIFSSAGTIGVRVGSATPATTNRLLVENNIVNGTAALSNAILANSDNIMVCNNMTSGSFTSGEIEAISAAQNIFFTGNYVQGSGVGGKLVRHLNATPTNASIFNNKNAQEKIVYSTLDGLQAGAAAWTTSITLPGTVQLVSAAGTNRLIVPLTHLPIGSQLVSVSLYADTPTAAGTLDIRLLRRSSTAVSTVDVGSSSGASNTAFIYQQISITPASTHYIRTSEDYFLVITSTAAGNIVGQVVAFINR